MRKYSNSLVIMKVKIETSRYLNTLIRLAKITKSGNPKCWCDPSYAATDILIWY